ncbi:MAG: ABC transporter ATP-binding protein, partial [Candidatus Korarchaeota archaeon]|nr:ABC transporter ATP-binding protein [Candidatus Korarchaeota archaeon]
LSVGEQQKVEIIKSLCAGAEILILDEPTSVLTPQEANDLFNILRRMRAEGKGIVFITHKLAEVFAVADRVTVMRKGRVVDTLPVEKATRGDLARMMVGREVVFTVERRPAEVGKPVLEVENLVVLGDRSREAVRGVSFQVREGEILGVAGVAGNGQRELVHAIVGLRKVKSGTVRILGVDTTNKSPREIAELGVGHIPEERLKYGIVPNLSVAENSILKSYYKSPYRKGLTIDYSEVRRNAENLINEYGIVVPSPETPAKLLSGGNMQKLIVGRELKRRPKLIIALNPTFGLDVGATEYIRKILLEQRDAGAAILLVSGDLDEVLQLSDRIAVMFNGQFMGIVRPEEVTVEEIGLMMSGVRPEAIQ